MNTVYKGFPPPNPPVVQTQPPIHKPTSMFLTQGGPPAPKPNVPSPQILNMAPERAVAPTPPPESGPQIMAQANRLLNDKARFSSVELINLEYQNHDWVRQQTLAKANNPKYTADQQAKIINTINAGPLFAAFRSRYGKVPASMNKPDVLYHLDQVITFTRQSSKIDALIATQQRSGQKPDPRLVKLKFLLTERARFHGAVAAWQM